VILDLLPWGDDKSKITTASGGRGIRTHEERELLAVFKTAAIGH
jgi:hypothetical protein